MSFRFVKYACGCIGFPPLTGLVEDKERQATTAHTLLVKDCNEGEISLAWRTLDYHRWLDKYSDGEPRPFTRSEPISEQETEDLLAEIRSLMTDGESMRTVRAMLKEGA